MKLVEGNFFQVLVQGKVSTGKKLPSMKRVFCTHLMRSGLGKIMLEEISFLSEHLSLFRRCSHVEISEPVKLLLMKKIHDSKPIYKMGFGLIYPLSVSFSAY